MTDMAAQNDQKYCIDLINVEEAAKRIAGTAHLTPVLTSDSLMKVPESYDDGKHYFFKVEAMQKTGSFKFRGALNAVRGELESLAASSSTSSSTSSSSALRVVTHSSGNHAQALALASKLSSDPTRGTTVQATIVMPRNAPLVKKRAVESFGATIVMVDNTNEAREEEADRIVANSGAAFIHPSEDPRVIAGQGTVSWEFVRQVRDLMIDGDDLDAVIIPVGGGGLASGNIVCLRGLLGHKVKIILAEPSELDDAKRSFDAGELLQHRPDNQLDSVADGLKTTLGPNTWPIVRDLVDDIFTVSEREILRCTKLVWERLKVAIEPSAGVGVAVAQSKEFNDAYPKSNGIHNVGVILCGGNFDVVKISNKMREMGL